MAAAGTVLGLTTTSTTATTFTTARTARQISSRVGAVAILPSLRRQTRLQACMLSSRRPVSPRPFFRSSSVTTSNSNNTTHVLGEENSVRSSKGGHHRSQSDAIEPRRLRMRKTSRDIGIVGTSITLSPTQVKKMELTNDRHDDSADLSQPQISPVFQTPHFNNDAPRQNGPLLEKAESLMQEARASRERGA